MLISPQIGNCLNKGVLKSYFSHNLKFLRNKLGVSLTKLSEEVNIPSSTLHMYERGSDPTHEPYLNLCAFFRIDPYVMMSKDLEQFYENVKENSNDLKNHSKEYLIEMVLMLKHQISESEKNYEAIRNLLNGKL